MSDPFEKPMTITATDFRRAAVGDAKALARACLALCASDEQLKEWFGIDVAKLAAQEEGGRHG